MLPFRVIAIDHQVSKPKAISNLSNATTRKTEERQAIVNSFKEYAAKWFNFIEMKQIIYPPR